MAQKKAIDLSNRSSAIRGTMYSIPGYCDNNTLMTAGQHASRLIASALIYHMGNDLIEAARVVDVVVE